MNSDLSRSRSLILEHMESARFPEARVACQDAMRDQPENVEPYVLHALCDEQLNDFESALKHLRKAIGIASYNPALRYHFGRISFLAGHTDEAQKQLRRCLELDPNQVESWTLLARIHRREGRSEQALTGLKTALRADENYVPASITLASMMLEAGDLENAERRALHAVETAPDNPTAQYLMARVFSARGYVDFAQKCIENARRLNPSDTPIRLLEVVIAQQQGRHRDALRLLHQIDELDPTAREYSGLIRCRSCLALGQLKAAKDIYEALLETTPVSREVWIGLSDVYVQLNQSTSMTSLSDRAVAASVDDDLKTWLQLQAHQLAGNSKESQELGRSLFSSEDGFLRLNARLFVARSLLAESDEAALADVLGPLVEDAALTYDIGKRAANLARLALDLELALDILQSTLDRGLVVESERPRINSMRVDLLDRLGRFSESQALFKEAQWQPPFLGDPVQLEADVPTSVPDLSALRAMQWPASEAALNRPILFWGWPCTGQDLLLQTLSVHSGLPVLHLKDWPVRRQALESLGTIQELAEVEEPMLHLIRRKYSRHLALSDDSKFVETRPLMPMHLPHWARIFPGASVVLSFAEDRYLEMQWQLLGYQRVNYMAEILHRDIVTIKQFKDFLPLDFVVCELNTLIEQPQNALTELCRTLSIPFREEMVGTLSKLAQERGYRSPQHWKNYS